MVNVTFYFIFYLQKAGLRINNLSKRNYVIQEL